VTVTFLFVTFALATGCGEDDSPGEPTPVVLHPECTKSPTARVDAHTPQSQVDDWGPPIRLGSPINTLCPEDAIEISGDGQYLYFMFSSDRLEDLTPAQILARSNNTYRAQRSGGPGDFMLPVYYDLAKGVTTGSLDGELSFSPDGGKVYFHSNRASNLGYQASPPTDDYIDIYVADVVDGLAGPATNLGPPVNSVYPDGEHALHPDGVSLYFASRRPDNSLGGVDIWVSTLTDSGWTEPVNPGTPVNSIFDELQPTFTPDGDTMYFTSDRNILIGAAIYRTVRTGGIWGTPELTISGIVGEASLTTDGQLLYFVHVLSDTGGTFDADIWYCERVEP